MKKSVAIILFFISVNIIAQEVSIEKYKVKNVTYLGKLKGYYAFKQNDTQKIFQFDKVAKYILLKYSLNEIELRGKVFNLEYTSHLRETPTNSSLNDSIMISKKNDTVLKIVTLVMIK